MILASVLTNNLAILVLAGFVGFIVISKIPNTLHTPLMSGTNAVHGIVLLGALIALGFGGLDGLSKGLLVIAVAFGTINIVGGFLVTDRMLEMFKSKPAPAAAEPAKPAPKSAEPAAAPGSADSPAAAEPATKADAPDAATQEQPRPGAAGPAPSPPEDSTPMPEADLPPEQGEQA